MTLTATTWQWLVPLACLLLALAAVLIRRTLSAIKRERAYLTRVHHRRARLAEDVAWTLRPLEAQLARELHEERTGIPAFAAGVERIASAQ